MPPLAVVASAAPAALGDLALCPGDVVPSVLASLRALAASGPGHTRARGRTRPYRGLSEPFRGLSERASLPAPLSLPLLSRQYQDQNT